MTNSSATGGVLLPDGTVTPVYDDDLDAMLQGYVVALTGLDGQLVRPRWQSVVPKQPEPEVNWCSLSAQTITPDASPFIENDSDLTSKYQRHEVLEVLCSFYGPNARSICAQFRDGLSIPQNNEYLTAFKASFINASQMKPAPELVNQTWIKRQDMTFRIKRQVVRSYPIQSFTTAPSITSTDG